MVGNIAANVVMKATEIATDAATKVFQDLEATKQTARSVMNKTAILIVKLMLLELDVVNTLH